MTETCVYCDRPATWMRATQFAGDHPFCEVHASEEKDFGVEDSYQSWYPLEEEKISKEVFDPASVVIDDMGIVHVDTKTMVKTTDVDDKLERIKRKIEPFLDNLARNPDKAIVWPGRDKKIAEFKRELWDIIDG